MSSILLSFLMLSSSLSSAAYQAPASPNEDARIDIDVKDADVVDVLRLIAEIGELNLVADPDVSCEATLKLQAVPWPQVLDVVLRSCGLAEEWLGKNLLRVATSKQIREEYAERRKYDEEKRLSGPLSTRYRRLAYARAEAIAPILEKFLSARGSVVYDERTNTLIITDVAR